MKILIVSRGYPSKKEPQWGCFELDQAKALQALGHDVAIMSVDRRFRAKNRKFGITYREIGGLTVINSTFVPLYPLTSLFYRISCLYFRVTYRYLVDKWGKPDIIYSHYLMNTAPILPIAQKERIPLVGLEHWSKLKNPRVSYGINYMVMKTYGKHGLKLLTVSESLKKSIIDKYGVASDVVPNMLGSEFLHEYDETKCNKFTFIGVGSLNYGKGFDLLIKAAHELKERLFNNWEIVIIGEGSERKNLQGLIDALGMHDNIILLGAKTKDEICKNLASSHVFVLPSRSETFGVVYIEAMAIGLPVIATNCGIPDDLVNKENGLVCDVEDHRQIAEAMIYMMNHINEYDSETIRRNCLCKYSPQVIAKKIENILLEAINK